MLKFISRKFAAIMGLFLTIMMVWLSQTSQQPINQLVQRLEHVGYDLRMNAGLPGWVAQDDRIAIVTIDEKSLASEGQWPWPRQRLAELTRKLVASGAVIIGYDFMFPEAQKNYAEAILEEPRVAGAAHAPLRAALREIAPAVSHDRDFAAALAEGETVLGYAFHHDTRVSPGQLPPPADAGEVRESLVTRMESYTANLAALQQAAGSGGFITTGPDEDGVLRRTPMILEYNHHLYTSLSLEMMRLFLLLDDIKVNYSSAGDATTVESIGLGSLTIPTDAYGRVLIPYRGGREPFRYVSASDVLAGDFHAADIENRLVLVGASAIALSDLKATPVRSLYPGVEVHASLLAAMLDERFPVEPSWATGANISVMLLGGMLLSLLMPWIGPGFQVLLSTTVTGAFVATNFWLWQRHGLSLDIAMPLLLLVIVAGLNVLLGFLRAANQRGVLKSMFGQYVPASLVEQMMYYPEQVSMEGSSREMTVLFADIRGFTTLSETLPPNELKKLLNDFFTPMTRIIFENNGTIDKYVGDMIMAFWGAPLEDPDHARNAVKAALQMFEFVAALKARYREQGLPEINIGIGINTGIMNVGDMGSEYRRAYTVIGDAVNLGSRIEGLTKFYGVGLVVGENTWRYLQPQYLCRKLDRVRVKGKKQGVEVYQPLIEHERADAALQARVARHNAALQAFWDQEWDRAEAAFRQLQGEEPEATIYQIYLQRITVLRQSELPADWDGVFERRSK